VEDVEDFSYKVTVRNVTFHFREIIPKDFYYAQVLRQSSQSQLELVERLLLNPEVLDESNCAEMRKAMSWVSENLLDKTILSVENWLEVAYHLCKQRWDSSVDWLEAQPMSKINAMIEIVKKHAEEQEKEMKKSARRKK
jgi:hypothetical protein